MRCGAIVQPTRREDVRAQCRLPVTTHLHGRTWNNASPWTESLRQPQSRSAPRGLAPCCKVTHDCVAGCTTVCWHADAAMQARLQCKLMTRWRDHGYTRARLSMKRVVMLQHSCSLHASQLSPHARPSASTKHGSAMCRASSACARCLPRGLGCRAAACAAPAAHAPTACPGV